MQRENLVDYVRDDIGPYLQEKWRTLSEHPLVGETRMVGLMGNVSTRTTASAQYAVTSW
jgi:putrescine aminotransferase